MEQNRKTSKFTKAALIIHSLLLLFTDVLVGFMTIICSIITIFLSIVAIIEHGTLLDGVDMIIEALGTLVGAPLIVIVLTIIYNVMHIVSIKNIKKNKSAIALFIESLYLFIISLVSLIVAYIVTNPTIIVLSLLSTPFTVLIMVIAVIGLVRTNMKK